jgi:hypothetical protein
VTVTPSKTTYAASQPRQATFVAYINGIEVPAKSASIRYGVWQMPEMQLEMVADPILVRLGSEDRVQVAVFYLDDCDVDPSVQPEFRLFGEGEITGWGYRNTASGRSIVFTVVNQIAVFTQLFVQFMTTLDDMIAHSTHPGDVSGFANASSQLVYPFALFNQGLIPGAGASAPTRITRPFDYLFNAVRGMMASNIPNESRTVPAANFFTRWARLNNFHNRFAASPFFDEVTDNTNIFPILKALQNVSAVDVIVKDLLPNLQNAGSIWDMVQLVYSTMLMEVAMIPGMPLVTVDLVSNLVQTTDFAEHKLIYDPARVGNPAWIPALAYESRKKKPKRLQNYFPKPQMLFSVPPACNVLFPSQILSIAYDENFATQPTRLYFNDEVLTTVLKIPKTGVGQAIPNALSIAWPLEADALAQARDTKNPSFNGKNFLLYPEEFFKGPVMDRRTIPPWLFFLKQSENKAIAGTAPIPQRVSDSPSNVSQTPPPARTGTTTPPKPKAPAPPGTMVTQSHNGRVNDEGVRVYLDKTEALRTKVENACRGTRVPSEFALTWINMESGGDRWSTDGDQAKGYFQLLPEECARLRTKSFPNGVKPSDLVNTPNLETATDTAILCGVEYIMSKRAIADQLAKNVGLAWTEADMWRLTKFRGHNLPAYAAAVLPQVKASLGHAPVNWEEFYNEAIKTATSLQLRAINNATATGVLPGASGTMVSASDPTPFTAGAVRSAPAAPPNAATTRTDPPATAPAVPQIDAATTAAINANALDVYHLYAKFEYFRERYAKRNGSATIVWNPYVVPGFPGVLFDNRASRVDLLIYITTVQHRMSNDGQRGTTLSYLYGRQFQEMFKVMADEFALNDAVARGSAPEEPIRDVSKITQSFIQAETYYQRLFYGAQPLFGKDAAFDFRKIVGMAPEVAGGAPELIFVDGPDVATQDTSVAAAQTIKDLTTLRDQTSAAVLDIQSRIAAAQATLAALKPVDDPSATDIYSIVVNSERTSTQATLTALQQQLPPLQAKLSSLTQRINAALSTLQGAESGSSFTRVEHNLDQAAIRPLVPLPTSEGFFESRDAAMRYNWRPICTLDEYVVFFDSAAEGAIPAFGAPRSVGARFYERIRTFIPPEIGEDGQPVPPPPGIDGLSATTSVVGLNSTNFPQTRSNWDDMLIAYRNNVINVKAPRT